MKFRIKHHTLYQYATPVFFEPHLLRLIPRQNAYQKLLSPFKLTISPEPRKVIERIGLFNEIDHVLWLTEQETTYLEITTDVTVEVQHENPFNFTYYPYTTTCIPFNYPEDYREQLQPFLQKIVRNWEEVMTKKNGTNQIIQKKNHQHEWTKLVKGLLLETPGMKIAIASNRRATNFERLNSIPVCKAQLKFILKDGGIVSVV